MDKKGGYLEVSPVPAPVLPALPKGEALSVSALEGTWTGEIRFYRVSPAQMVLDLRREGEIWKGHLEIKYNSNNFADESFDLEGLKIDERTLTFNVPKSPGVDDLGVSFRGVCPATDKMRGTAEAIRKGSDPPLQFRGTWSLNRVKSPPMINVPPGK